jgi:ABC-type sulfate transport system substrate-binding protein
LLTKCFQNAYLALETTKKGPFEIIIPSDVALAGEATAVRVVDTNVDGSESSGENNNMTALNRFCIGI